MRRRAIRIASGIANPVRGAWIVLSALLCGPAPAQDGETIVAERPGFSSSPTVLAPSVLQLETGYEYVRVDSRLDSHTLPLALIRVGVVDRLELQFAWAGYSWLETQGPDASGILDASVGIKYELNGPDTTVPVALFAGLTVPMGDDAFSSDNVDPRLGLFWSHSGSADWFGTATLTESDGEVLLGNALGLSLPVNANTSGYVEYFGIYGNGGPEHFLNGGLAYTPRSNLQLDLNGGAGLNSRAADFFVGAGLAYRF